MLATAHDSTERGTAANLLGTALWKLGERESGTARLEEAVTAWDDCLSAVQSAWPAGRVDDVRAHQDAAKAEIKRRSAQ